MNQSLISKIARAFDNRFGGIPLMVQSPGRINIIGEHTDYNEGFVLPAAIDKYIVSALMENNSDRCSVYALDKEEHFEFDLKNLKPVTKGSWKNFVIGISAELLKRNSRIKPFNLVFGGDIPDGAGLSSSAALENSLVFGLNSLFDLQLSKAEMILISQQAEHNYVGVKCGIMDQYASMFGKKDHALLLDCRSVKAEPVEIELGDYQFILVNTNVSHKLAENAYNERRASCERVANRLGAQALRDLNEADLNRNKNKIEADDFRKAKYVIQENERVLMAAQALREGRIEDLGSLMFQAHEGVRNLYEVSCDELDFLVDLARKEQYSLGSRMMGGGFGGCTLNIVKRSQVKNFEERVKESYIKTFGKPCSVYHIKIVDGVKELGQESIK